MNGTQINDSPKSLEDELLDLLASQARKVIAPVFLVSAMIASFATPYVAKSQWIGWLVAVFGILLARWIVIPKLAGAERLTRRGRLFVIVTLSLLHGSIQAYSLTFFPHMEVVEQTMQTMLLAGLCMAAVSTSGGYLPFFFAFVLPIMVPLITLWAISVGSSGQAQLDLAVALAAVLFLAVLVSVAADTYKQFRNSYESRRKLSDAIESKTRFLATASHDLRQPMQSLSASIEALDSYDLDEATKAIVHNLNIAKEDLSGLLRALLDISRLDAGVEDLEPRDFSLYRLLFAVADEFTHSARKKGLDLKLDCAEDVCARTNPMQFKRIVSNLVDNAIRNTFEGEVSIQCSVAGSNYIVKVADTGIGIDKDDMESIFDDFRQLGGTGRSQKRTGLGLGLSIVRRLVDQLKLDLVAESEPGEGSIFSIVVPQGRTDGVVGIGTTASPFEFTGLHVLVVDDEEDVARSIQIMLQRIGCEVRTAGGTDSALTLIGQLKPDVMLVDRRLEDGDDGLVLIERARQNCPGLPTILISGDTAPGRLKEAENAGVPALVKPASIEEIKNSIALVCGQSQAGL